jgi:hypothetical protein
VTISVGVQNKTGTQSLVVKSARCHQQRKKSDGQYPVERRQYRFLSTADDHR